MMAPSGSKSAGGRRSSRGAVIAIAVAAFLVIDIALVGIAVMRSDPPNPGATPGPIPTFGSSAQLDPTPQPTNEPAVSGPHRHLVASGAGAGWRSTVGDCTGEAAVVELSSDGGSTWQAVNPPGVHEVLYLSANATVVTVIAKTGATCELEVLKSFTAGQFWSSYPNELTDYTFLDSTEPPTVLTSGGPVIAPCPDVRDARQRAEAVVVTCDGQLFEGGDGDWTAFPVPGLLAVAVGDSGYTLAVSGYGDCAGVSIQTLAAPLGDSFPDAVGCVDGPVLPSQVSIAQLGSDVWLWIDDRVAVSADAGTSWN